MQRLAAVSALVAAAALALAPAVPAGIRATTFHIRALASGLRFSSTHLVAKQPGRVTIVMKNLSPLPHDVAIRGRGVSARSKVVTRGRVAIVRALLKKGTYQFLCTVDGHARAGMKGTLTVR